MVQPRPLLCPQVFLSQLDQSADLLWIAFVNADGLRKGRVEPVVGRWWKDILQNGVDSWGISGD